jgi:hypothetical protein
MTEKESVSKLEAAERQLKTAIRLFFAEGDSISIHTLVCSADGILTDLCKHRGKYPGFMRDVELYIVDGYEQEWLRAVNKAQNFFKHADKDPDGIYEFPAELTPGMLVSAIQAYGNLTDQWFLEAKVFFGWFSIKNPKFLKDSEFKDTVRSWLDSGLDPNDLSGILFALDNHPPSS